MFKEKGKDTGMILIIIKPIFIAYYLPDMVLSVRNNGRGGGRMDRHALLGLMFSNER